MGNEVLGANMADLVDIAGGDEEKLNELNEEVHRLIYEVLTTEDQEAQPEETTRADAEKVPGPA